MMHKILDQLGQLLDAEKRALLAGDLDTLEEFASQKTTLIDEIEQSDLFSPELLVDLLAKFREHDRLVRAAQAGVEEAIARLDAQRSARSELQTYGHDGAGHRITTNGPATERRF